MFLWEVRKAMSRFLAGSWHGRRERKEERREHPPEPWWWWGSAKLSLVTGGCVVSLNAMGDSLRADAEGPG